MSCTGAAVRDPGPPQTELDMRPETLAIVDEIKQSLSLLRRYL
jgi:hypothetical protein